MPWLNDLIESTEEAESPSQFIYWSGLCAISAILRKNVYLNKFYYHLYPNIYVMLVAKPGGRKGFPVKLAKKLVQAVNSTRIISGRNSIQSVLKELSTAYTFPDGKAPMTAAHAFLVSPEFTNLIIDDPGSLAILTELYDTHDNEPEWKNTLKGSGTENLKEPCITMLGASNQTHFNNRVTAIDVNGGFVGRTLLILDDTKGKINPLTEEPKTSFDVTKLIDFLIHLSELKGEFHYSSDGKRFFEEWYKSFRKQNFEESTGVADRFHDHVLKVAMLLSVSESDTLILEQNHIETSLELCNKIIGNVKRVTGGTGKSQFGPQTKIVIDELLKADENKLSRRKLLQKHYGEFDAMDLDRIIITLISSGVVTEMIYGKETWYLMNKEIVEQFNSYLKQVIN